MSNCYPTSETSSHYDAITYAVIYNEIISLYISIWCVSNKYVSKHLLSLTLLQLSLLVCIQYINIIN